ncbi:DNA-binding transcriptional regulator YhcF (GntR family) [Alkalibacillus flavidus]|uniref:DNA-binding transcriptional regulator YhcF (GntR family) n=1 Tax=Alkalibacillus flavidus TaxID=546021 RepID=A0ABV2KWY8_9BACI
MSGPFRDDRPIFLQVREMIEDQILNDQLQEGEQAPSTNQLVNVYKINHLTVSKGINQLVDEGILYKKRGVGMFVSEGAKTELIEQRKQSFVDRYVKDMLAEADKLNMSEDELIRLIQQTKREES